MSRIGPLVALGNQYSITLERSLPYWSSPQRSSIVEGSFKVSPFKVVADKVIRRCIISHLHPEMIVHFEYHVFSRLFWVGNKSFWDRGSSSTFCISYRSWKLEKSMGRYTWSKIPSLLKQTELMLLSAPPCFILYNNVDNAFLFNLVC